MSLSDLDAARNRTVRGSYVLGVYRWLLGVGFLFVAFNEFPQHKWSIGLGLLVFNAGVEAVGRGIASLTVGLELRLDAGERLSRWATLLAPIRAPHVDLSDRDETAEFWDEMRSRGEGEAKRLREKVTSRWDGLAGSDWPRPPCSGVSSQTCSASASRWL